jgi:hypothetical protein
VFLTLTPDVEVDDEAGERLLRGLRADIISLDVDSIEPVAGGRAPSGAKSADPVTIKETGEWRVCGLGEATPTT